ncbi:MAG: ABC transporter substrate-binding protein [Lachnospiraceae bacterium]|jgi:putative aldouronate transport system substrate-binding protein|nr:ABC transporter substrate-binding protein [uncultured Acetatifactor sp.]MCI9229796.1 ABC transporter substrate-binding protein [Lachnospiraceae bacterium]MCI9573289.1 ABC transporter substrate-binding protein [Lachnospiraceae bacterium]
MKRKLVAMLCVASMTAAMLSGCGDSSGGEKSSQAKEESPESTEQSAEEKPSEESSAEESSEVVSGEKGAADLEYVELKWDALSYQPDNIKDVDLIQAALDEYFKEKLNCRVILNPMEAGDFKETVPTRLMSGEEMDIFTICGDIPYSNYANMGAFFPIDTVWDEYGSGVKSLFGEGVWDSLKVKDHIYGVPVLKDNCYIIGYVYNKTLADELELDMEQGWANFSEMEEYLVEAVKLRNEKFPEYAEYPLMIDAGDICPSWVALERFGAGELAVCNIPGKEAVSEFGTDTVFNFYGTDAFREMCLAKQRMVETGVLAYDGSIFETNLLAEPSTLLNAAWGYAWIDEHLYGDSYATKLVVFDDVWTDGGNYTGAMTGIGANCKNPERAMMAIELFNTDPYLATLLRFGVEGEHWEKDADGKMQLANRNADVANAGWLQWYGPFYGNLTIVDTPESYSGPDGIMLQKMAEYNNEAILAAHMGFVLDTTPIENELSACNNVVSEYYTDLAGGRHESAEAVNQTIDEMNAKLKENGVEKIVAEVQARIDAWAEGK